ncbi:uncharacterized protein CDAR_312281 [Caerostris darwini]|uniref:Uncharacterized protein n=1 Tax=Caerostris darwini TaxID=1538125 RepID=A0AAV4QQN4_9ARAC|nr:uncharacterized protein CDAR_312281 [Caerostris darwini]
MQMEVFSPASFLVHRLFELRDAVIIASGFQVKVIENGTIDEFDHKNPPLNDKVLEVIKPIYESLSADSLLERCLGSETQNNNESLNSLIWTFAPKHIHAGPKTIEIATFFAVSIFNEGFIPILKILDVMVITIGPDANAFAARRDEVG